PAGGADAWRARAIAPARHADWPDDGPLFGGEPAAPTVGALLDGGASLGGDGDPSFLEIHRDGDGDDEIVTGAIAGEDAVLRWHATIASALREAADAGGTGTAAILLPAFGGATRVTLTAGASSVDTLPAQR